MNLKTMDAVVAHAIALLLTSGFIGIGYATVLGFVDLKEPVVTGFIGTLIGTFGSKVELILAKYFARIRVDDGEVQKAPKVAKEKPAI